MDIHVVSVAATISATLDTYSCTCTYIYVTTFHRNGIAGSQAMHVLSVITGGLIALQKWQHQLTGQPTVSDNAPVPTPLSTGGIF